MDPSTISAIVPFLVETVAAGHPPGPPPRAEDHVPIEHYVDAWRRARATHDDAFPLRVVAATSLEDSEVFGFPRDQLRDARPRYERTAAYRALYSVGARWELEHDAASTRLYWYPWPGDVRDVAYRAAMDYAVADMANAIRRLGAEQPSPTAVHLAHAAPVDVQPFAAHYGVAPSYGRALYELVYPTTLPAMKIATFNSRLRDYFDAQCKELVERMGATSTIVAQLRRLFIAAMDGGDTGVEVVAKHLGLSSRSLQRKLADEGTTYNDVLVDVRVEFAKRYLARGSVSASEVAYLIGFTEPPAFFKAFKRWTGMTPREFSEAARSA